MSRYSKTHFTVNDDVYGKILKSNTDFKPRTEYAEVYEACEGLGIPIYICIYSMINPNMFSFDY